MAPQLLSNVMTKFFDGSGLELGLACPTTSGGFVAEEGQTAAAEGKKEKPTLFIILAVINMAFLGAVAFMFYASKKKEAAEPKIENVVKGEKEALEADAIKAEEDYIGHLVPLETFLVNLAGVRGGKLMKVTMTLELDNAEVQEEVDKRKPQVRDLILILLSSKTYDEVNSKQGKDFLRDEIKDRINTFLTKGKVRRVLFTEFFFN